MITCTSCQKDNPPGSKFCQSCGTPLLSLPNATVIAHPSPPPSPPILPISPPPFSDPIGYPPTFSTYPAPMGSVGTSTANFWGPFAGYGRRGRHASWLLDNLGSQANTLHKIITQRFQERQIPHTQFRPVTLTGYGLFVEQRLFYVFQRKITTVAFYIAQFGKDLYISTVTYAKNPINKIRVAIAIAMILFELFFIFGYGPALLSELSSISFLGGSPDYASLVLLLCVLGPLGWLNGLFIGLGLLYSLYKWFTEKDFWAALRMPPNEFDLDDILALEKSVEQTVRESLDKLGLQNVELPERPASEFNRRII